ncbi:MAG: hypothetical protein A2X59_03995 [Nitrospirae bacterium GWC2_42_7]|nr:MAG: hypothetical protein A2X59_03995 [Nitrospirae bacterium GWC2_42_7]
MDSIKFISFLLIAAGALLLVFALMPARKTWNMVPEKLRAKWLAIMYLICFFVVGYIFFEIVLITDIHFFDDIVTGLVFLGGAIFVFITIKLSKNTIQKMTEMDNELKLLNKTLEQRVKAGILDLQHSYDFTSNVIDSIPDAMAVIDVTDFHIVSVNKAFLRELDLQEDMVLLKTCHEVTHQSSSPCGPPNDICPLHEMLLTGKSSSAEHIHYNSSGEKLHFEVTTTPIKDNSGMIILAIHIARDITARKKAEEKIKHLAYYDNITGLPNRTFYKELLAREIAYARRYNQPLFTLFIDLDSFKQVNDTLGHDIGDQLLKAVGDRLARSLRNSDEVARMDDGQTPETVSRLGGDEFIVLLRGISKTEDAAIVAGRILQDISEPLEIGGHEITITASIGISVYPTDGEDVKTLMKSADLAMYHAKDKGKNNYQFYSSNMNVVVLKRLSLENDLRKALEHNEFLLYYQPKVAIKNNKIVGAEALLRWQHPGSGIVSPLDFIPVAEETGLIVPIGEWVIRTACQQNKEWQKLGFEPISIAVNLSNRQFEQSNLLEMIIRTLKEIDMATKYVELEITESSLMKNPDAAIAILNELKDIGITIAIDDFGTGYSSLEYLKRIPLNSLKIALPFIRNILTSPDDAAITKTIITLAHNMNLKVIAEGVETKEQLDFLRTLGCDEVQGYFFSKPLPADEFMKLLQKGYF